MTRFTSFIVRHRVVTLLAAFLLCLAGLWAWFQLDVEAYPDISDNEVNLMTQVNGLPAEEMEQQVTIPLERALNTVPGVIAKRSRTIFGLSKITLSFGDHLDLYLARQLVLEKLRDVELPEGAVPELGPMTMAMGEIFRYVLEGPPDMPLTTLTELQEYVVIPKLLQAEGVADVSNFGGLIKQYQVIVNPLQLEKYGLKVGDIADAITANNRNTGGNFIRIGATQMNIRGLGRITGADDIGAIVVDNRDGVPILVRDLGAVEVGNLPPNGILGYSDMRRNWAESMGIEGIVLMKKYENPSRTMRRIYEKVQELNDGLLPAGVRIEPFYDRTELVDLTVHTVLKTLLEGMVVVVVILTLLLGNWRAALISALAIPFSLLFAFVCIHRMKIPANLLSLGAMDFGIIADASVVMVEAIFRHLHAATPPPADQGIAALIIRSCREIQKQIVFTVGIIVLALLPMFTLQRVEGRLFTPMAWTLSFAILGSLVYSLTVVPVLSSYLPTAGQRSGGNRFWTPVQRAYDRLLALVLDRPGRTLALVALVVVVAAVLVPRLGTEFLPELDEGSVWVRVFLPSGISLEAAKPFAGIVRREIGGFPEVEGIMTQLGRTDDGADPFGPNRIETLVQLRQPYSSWPGRRRKTELVQAMKARLEDALPGASFTFSQPIIDMVTENATGSSSDLAVFITGKDLDTLRALGERVLQVVKTIPGASESAIEQEKKQTQVEVAIDRQAAARYGINVADINTLLETAIGGLPVSTVREEDRTFDIVLRFTKESRNTPESIAKLIVQSKSGLRIPLGQVAAVRLVEGQSVIFRDNQRRLITVKTNVRGRDQGGFAAEAARRIAAEVRFPANYTYSLGGQFENLRRSRVRLSLIVPLTLLLIFVVLLVLFRYNHIHALIVMANIPLALAGGIAALYLRGIHLSISASVGFVSLSGICIMTGVLWLSYLNRLRKHDQSALRDIVLRGSHIQFRPRFMVVLIAVIGLLPAALNTGVGSDVQRPLATVIVGGLCSSLALTVFVTPLLYFLHERRRESRLGNPEGKKEG